MNATSIKSIGSGNALLFSVSLSLEIFVLPFYAGWVLYFLSEIHFLRRKMRALVHRGSEVESTRLLYKCRGDLYKNILICIIAVMEPISFIPAILSLIPSIAILDFQSSSNIDTLFLISSDLRLLTFVLTFTIIFLFSTLTKHLINVCKSDYRIQLLPPIQHRLIILTLVLMLLAVIKLAIDGFDGIIIKIVCNIFSCYEFYHILHDSKQLYHLLKWRYEDMRYESNYPLYMAHKRVALKYKYLTICLIFVIFFQTASGWVNVPFTIFLDLLGTPFTLNPGVFLFFEVLKWFNIVLCAISSSSQFLLVAVTLYYIAAVCLNRIGWRSGENRVRYLHEPILQQKPC